MYSNRAAVSQPCCPYLACGSTTVRNGPVQSPCGRTPGKSRLPATFVLVPNNQSGRPQIGFFAASHAAAIKHEGVSPAQSCDSGKANRERPRRATHASKGLARKAPKCHANTAANNRITEKKSPNALKKVRLNLVHRNGSTASSQSAK